MRSMTASDARNDFSNTINEVSFKGERVEVTRNGKAIAAIISREDLALLEILEDRIDLQAAREAMIEGGSVPWEEVKAKLGL
jgi:prevent-host-death family protein